MSAIVNVALPVFAIMLVGYLAGRFRILGPESSEPINAFVYWFALPPVLFLSMAKVPPAEAFNWPFIWTFVLGMAAVALPAALLARFVFPNRLAGLTLHGLSAIFSNTGYMGIPLFLAAFGPDGTFPAVITTAINAAVVIGLTILLVELDSEEPKGVREAIVDAVAAVLKGPLFLAAAAGILWSWSGWDLPVWLENFAVLMGAAAGPAALFAMGLFLYGKPMTAGLGEVGWLVFLKLIVHPLVTWWLAVAVFDLEFEMVRGAVLMAALPAGALAFVVAQRYGIFVQRSSAMILVSTLFSVITVSALLAWFAAA